MEPFVGRPPIFQENYLRLGPLASVPYILAGIRSQGTVMLVTILVLTARLVEEVHGDCCLFTTVALWAVCSLLWLASTF